MYIKNSNGPFVGKQLRDKVAELLYVTPPCIKFLRNTCLVPRPFVEETLFNERPGYEARALQISH